MIWYKFRVGGYMADTMHLADAEDLAYRRLLDWCYISEEPLPLDLATIARRIRLDDDVVAPVLAEFFERTDQGYIHAQAQKDIAAHVARVDTNRKSGKLGGRPRKAL